MALINKQPYITPEMIEAWNEGGNDDISTYSYTMTDTSRYEKIAGGFKTIGKKCYVNIKLKLKISLNAPSAWNTNAYVDVGIADLPTPYGNGVQNLDITWTKKDGTREIYLCDGRARVYATAWQGGWIGALCAQANVSINGAESPEKYCHIVGAYDTV